MVHTFVSFATTHTQGLIMKVQTIALLFCIFATALAYPVLEDENGDLIELIPMRRNPRAARGRPDGRPSLVVMPPREPLYEEPTQYEPMASDSRTELVAAETGHGHSHNPYDYVDYGAYTGGYGAFGWYTDHPVYTYGH